MHYATHPNHIFNLFMNRLNLVVIHKVKGHKVYVGVLTFETLRQLSVQTRYQNDKYTIESYDAINKL